MPPKTCHRLSSPGVLRCRSHAAPLLFFALSQSAPRLSALARSQSKPVNDLPNPYRTVEGWRSSPKGARGNQQARLRSNKDGKSFGLRALHAEPLRGLGPSSHLKFDESGKLVKAFGAGISLAAWIDVDHEGMCGSPTARVRRTPAQRHDGPARVGRQGHQVFKFSPTEALMTLARRGAVASRPLMAT